MLRVLVLAVLGVSHATAGTVKDPACGPPKRATKLRTVRDVDWCNFAFGVGPRGGALREGHSSVHLYADIGKPHDTIARTLRGVVYGDLDGDGRLEAAIVLETSMWFARTGAHSGGTSVSIYALRRGTPTNLGSIATDKTVHAITLGKGVVTITSSDGTTKTTRRYRRDKDDLVEVATRRTP